MKLLNGTSEIFISGSIFVKFQLDKGKVNIPCLALNDKSVIVFAKVRKYKQRNSCVFMDKKGNKFNAVVPVDKNYDPLKLSSFEFKDELLDIYNNLELI